MTIIRNAATAQINSLGVQKVDKNKEYRLISYSMPVQTEDGLLLYNNLTDELVLLDSSEQDILDKKNIESKVFINLIEKWYLVPVDYDDLKLCVQVNDFMRFLYEIQEHNKPITEYTILPTTDCNARCFYCYELGRSRINMTDTIASDVADYIIKSCKGEKVTFRWFGGEPLYNLKAIDIICSKLKASGIEYSSGMISNGYLFDKETVEKAINLWNLQQVQITLDGTEEIYNRCKAFIYKDVNPYKIVLENIEMLLQTGIHVKIRMNADDHNMHDLFKLTDILHENYGKYSNISVYSQLIFEDTGNNKQRSQEKKDIILKEHGKLLEHIKKRGFLTKYTLDGYLRFRQCMADNPRATTILPDGHLGRCEHFSESHFWGSIYSDEKDYDVINLFKKVKTLPSECDYCPIRPACIQLEMCPDLPKSCTESIRKSYIVNTTNRIFNTYIEYKTGIKQKSDLWN